MWNYKLKTSDARLSCEQWEKPSGEGNQIIWLYWHLTIYKKVWNHQQDVYLFGYFDNRKAQSKIIYLQKAIEQSESKEQNVQDQLASVIKVVSIIIVKSSQGRN